MVQAKKVKQYFQTIALNENFSAFINVIPLWQLWNFKVSEIYTR